MRVDLVINCFGEDIAVEVEVDFHEDGFDNWQAIGINRQLEDWEKELINLELECYYETL